MHVHTLKQGKGFTVIEVIVSVAIFSIVMLVATGSIATIIDANKKAHSLKSVMTNLNFALESIMREVRMGSDYNCPTVDGYCTTFAFVPNHPVCNKVANPYIEYGYDATNKKITRILSDNNGSCPVEDMTAPEVAIESVRFYPLGIGANSVQPRVMIVINGTIGLGNSKSSFNIQTTVSQRSIDS